MFGQQFVPLYIFDLDGTLALIDHRRHLVEGGRKDWREFFAACVHDTPNHPVIQTFQQLYSIGCDIRIWSGRSDEVRQQTVDWLVHQLQLLPASIERILKMRAADDFTPDDQLKARWLASLAKGERQRLTAVFDDRQKVVDMWRRQGVACFQVAPGEF